MVDASSLDSLTAQFESTSTAAFEFAGNINATQSTDAAIGALNALSASFSNSFAQPLKAMLPRGFTPGYTGSPRAFFWFLFNDPTGLASECSQGAPAPDSACSYAAFLSVVTGVGIVIPIISMMYCCGFCCARSCPDRCECCCKPCKQPGCGGTRPSKEYPKAERTCCAIAFFIFFLLIAVTGIIGFLSTNQIGADMQDVITGMLDTTTFPDQFSKQLNSSFDQVEAASKTLVTSANSRLSGRATVKQRVKDLNDSIADLEGKFVALQQHIEGKTSGGAQNPCTWSVEGTAVEYDGALFRWKNVTGGGVWGTGVGCCTGSSTSGCVAGSHAVGVGGGATSANCKLVNVSNNQVASETAVACTCCCACSERRANLAETLRHMPSTHSIDELNQPLDISSFSSQITGAKDEVGVAIESFRGTFEMLSGALAPVQSAIGNQTIITVGALVLWGLGWAGLVFGCIGLITNKNCCWWTSFFMFCLCMFIFWLLFGISSIIVLPFGDLCDGLPRTGEDATAWLLTFATTSGAIDTVNSELRNLYKDCLVQSPGYSGNLWSVVGVSEASVREQFASFNVTAMIPSDKIATNLDTTSNTLAFSNSKALMKSMTAGPPGLDTLKTQLEAVVTAAVSQPDVDAATALLADIATFNTETGALLAAVKSQVDVVEARQTALLSMTTTFANNITGMAADAEKSIDAVVEAMIAAGNCKILNDLYEGVRVPTCDKLSKSLDAMWVLFFIISIFWYPMFCIICRKAKHSMQMRGIGVDDEANEVDIEKAAEKAAKKKAVYDASMADPSSQGATPGGGGGGGDEEKKKKKKKKKDKGGDGGGATEASVERKKAAK